MSAQTGFYAAQAESCARSAAESELPRQREKFERAGAAWLLLAKRESDIAAARDRRIAETAARSLAEG